MLLLLYVGWRRKWWTKPSDCPLFEEQQAGAADGDELGLGGGAGEGAGGRDAEGAGEASAGPVGSVGPSEDRLSDQRARAALRKERNKCSNTLHYSCTLLSQPLSVRLWALLGHGAVPVETFSNMVVTSLQTQKGIQELGISLVDGALLVVVVELFEHLFSPELADALEFNKLKCKDKSAHQKHQDSIVLQAAFLFITTLMGNLAETSAWFRTPPMAFIGGSTASAEMRGQWLQDMNKMWDVLETLERQALDNNDVKQYLKSMWWPSHQFVRETFLELWECDFKDPLTKHLHHSLLAYSRSHVSSLIVENFFKCARAASHCNRKGACEPLSAWHACAVGGVVAKEFHRQSVPVTQAARSAAPARVSPAIFTGHGHKQTLDEALLEDLTRA